MNKRPTSLLILLLLPFICMGMKKSNIGKNRHNTTYNQILRITPYEQSITPNFSLSFRTDPTMQPFMMMSIANSLRMQSLSALNNASRFVTESELSTACNRPITDYFGELVNEEHQTLSEVFHDESNFELKSISQKLFLGMSNKILFGNRQFFWAKNKNTEQQYIVKSFTRKQSGQFVNEMEQLISSGIEEPGTELGVINYLGCIYDKENIFIMLEPDQRLYSLSNNDVYNKFRNAPLKQKVDLFLKVSKIIKILHDKGIRHNMIAPDSVLISEDIQKVRLVHLESATAAIFGKILRNRTLRNVLPEEIGYSPINSDLFSLVKVFLHLDAEYFRSRMDKFGKEIYNEIQKARFESIYILYSSDNTRSPSQLLSFVRSKCGTKMVEKEQPVSQTSDSMIGSIMNRASGILSSFTQAEPEMISVTSCNGLKRLYEDILDPSSPNFITTIGQVIERLSSLKEITDKKTTFVLDDSDEDEEVTMLFKKNVQIKDKQSKLNI